MPLTPHGFVADYTTYFLEVCSAEEASYLVSVLNAPVVNAAIKDAQAKGLWGPRHVSKRVLDLPIPLFDEKNKAHRQLAELGERCARKVQDWIQSGGPGSIRSIGLLRNRVRQHLHAELTAIDAIVKPMLGL